MNISIIGTGYVGLVTGACFASLSNSVTCFDIDPKKIRLLQKGIIPFYEPGLENLVKTQKNNKSLKFSLSTKKSISFADVIFICVGTPQSKGGNLDLKYIMDYVDSLCNILSQDKLFLSNAKARKFIYIKSTIPPGTIKLLVKTLKKFHLDSKIFISSNPEFLKEGSAIQDFMKPDRVIIGASHPMAINIGKDLYRPILWKSDRMLITSPESSEIIKYASNSFLAMKISFINQIARLSDSVGADIHDIRKGVGMDERINPHFLFAGLGYGGSCFPKDVKALEYILKKNNIPADLSSATMKINSDQLAYFFNKILRFYQDKTIANKEFGFWGLAFKPNTDDIRYSSAISLVKLLAKKVKKIRVYEPIAYKNASDELKDFSNIIFVKTPEAAITNSDSLVIATEYAEFWNYPGENLLQLRDKCIFDGRNIMDKENMESFGLKYFGIGR